MFLTSINAPNKDSTFSVSSVPSLLPHTSCYQCTPASYNPSFYAALPATSTCSPSPTEIDTLRSHTASKIINLHTMDLSHLNNRAVTCMAQSAETQIIPSVCLSVSDCLSIDQSNIVNLLLWYKNVCPWPLIVSLFTNFSVHVWLTGRVLFSVSDYQRHRFALLLPVMLTHSHCGVIVMSFGSCFFRADGRQKMCVCLHLSVCHYYDHLTNLRQMQSRTDELYMSTSALTVTGIRWLPARPQCLYFFLDFSFQIIGVNYALLNSIKTR